MSDLIPVKRALLSVSDKTDLIPFARRLISHRVQIISTGGTAKTLADAGIDVTPIEQVTDFPEMLDGRVKTLHPKVHGGLLGLRDQDTHVAAMKQHGIEPIDLICVNLYPFEQTAAMSDVAYEQVIEQIDIGGPSMIRSAAKNHQFVAAVTAISQYDRVVSELDEHDGATTLALRRQLAGSAFARTAAYDAAISQWMMGQGAVKFPAWLVARLQRSSNSLRYGENPHQQAALYLEPVAPEASVAHAKQLSGSPLSFCNLYDADGALELIKEFNPDLFAAAAVIKHANPCGLAIGDSLSDAFTRAYEADPLAAFGGIVALNRPVDVETAQAIASGKKLLHVILAPLFDQEAAKLLAQRWKEVRLLQVGDLDYAGPKLTENYDVKRITAGLLVQQRDALPMMNDQPQWQHVAGPEPDGATLRQMQLAMVAAKHLKSNAVCIVHDDTMVGAGMGQVDRLAACELAVQRAGARCRGAVAGSDAFFPFRDGPDMLIDAGVRAIVQPGGSKKDSDTIEACEQANVSLVLTGTRHFRH